MTRKNRYYRRSRISEKRFRQLARLFALDLSASDTARLTALTTKTVNSIYLKMRRRIAQACERESPFASGEVEVDESYFGARTLVRAGCAANAVAARPARHQSLAS